MRAVFFDLDGTLVDLPADFGAVFESALADCGLDARDGHHERFTDALFEYLDSCHPEPVRAAMADLGDAFDLAADPGRLADAYAAREAAATTLRPGVGEAVAALDGPLGVLTNGAGRVQRRKLAHHGLDSEFDAVVVSGDVGAAKPDPGIFAAAREAVAADRYVFVADDLERDVRPAQKVGFTGVYCAEDATAADGADHAVESVEAVPALFG